MDDLIKWAPVAILLINSGACAFLWMVARTLATKGEVAELTQRVSDLEHGIHHVPGWEALDGLKRDIAEYSGDLKVLGARLEGLTELLKRVEHSVNLVQEQLLEAK